jgi:hypothetical protein
MPQTQQKPGRGGRRDGAGRPRERVEQCASVTIYVPESTLRTLRTLAAIRGESVSSVASRLLAESTATNGGYDPKTGSY